VGATLVDSFDSSSGEDESDSLLKFRHIDALFLEIGVLADRPSGVKLGSAGAVGISSAHLRTLFIYGANSRHNLANLHDIMRKCK